MPHGPIPSNAHSEIFLMSLWRHYLFSFSYKDTNRWIEHQFKHTGSGHSRWRQPPFLNIDRHTQKTQMTGDRDGLHSSASQTKVRWGWMTSDCLRSLFSLLWQRSDGRRQSAAWQTTARASHLVRGGTVDVALISCATWTQALSEIAISNPNLSAVCEKSRSNRHNSFLLGLPTNQLQPVQIEANTLMALSAAGINAVNAGRSVRLSV